MSLKICSENKLEPCMDKQRQILACHMITELFLHFYSFLDGYAFHIEGLPQCWLEKIGSKITAASFSSLGSSSF